MVLGGSSSPCLWLVFGDEDATNWWGFQLSWEVSLWWLVAPDTLRERLSCRGKICVHAMRRLRPETSFLGFHLSSNLKKCLKL